MGSLTLFKHNSVEYMLSHFTNTNNTISDAAKIIIEEAKTNALRSAIEQAFGTFISSKTEILNDNLVKDEVVSVANGNIQKFDVVSQVEIPNNGFAITLNVIVSINKLTSSLIHVWLSYS